ncbi:MAG: hypothetical protein JSW61_11335 [Candidatus Thorarchaeota archaeon]|nr:MAG: hypothetical protein JSW61_11335 [Candidatus Thorarchaeota archaeon]
MSEKQVNEDDVIIFPILRGESVGEAKQHTGRVVIVRTPDELQREWGADDIAVLDSDLEKHFIQNPRDLELLFSNVSVVLAEFGEAIGDFAAAAYAGEAIGVVKVRDATHVLEDDMRIRVVTSENIGDVFFID